MIGRAISASTGGGTAVGPGVSRRCRVAAVVAMGASLSDKGGSAGPGKVRRRAVTVKWSGAAGRYIDMVPPLPFDVFCVYRDPEHWRDWLDPTAAQPPHHDECL